MLIIFGAHEAEILTALGRSIHFEYLDYIKKRLYHLLGSWGYDIKREMQRWLSGLYDLKKKKTKKHTNYHETIQMGSFSSEFSISWQNSHL